MSRYFVSIFILLVWWGCENDINLINEITRKKGGEEIVHDVTLRYTDSGKIMVLLKTPVIIRTTVGSTTQQEFTEGIYCEFRHPQLACDSELAGFLHQ